MTTRPAHSVRPDAGFTLVELLVSSAVLGLIMAVLLGSMSSGLSLWRTTEGKIAADREGRSGHLLLAQDLANAVVPTNTSGPMTNLWPRITVNGTRLGFLVKRPPEYQAPGETGDVCYVEYLVQSNGLYRGFVGSADTYASLRNNQLPTINNADFQLLADNVVPNTNVLKGTAMMTNSDTGGRAVVQTNFIPVTFSNNAGFIVYVATQSGRRPDAIEVNLATADRDGVENQDLLNTLPNYKLRNAGYFTFRVNMPR